MRAKFLFYFALLSLISTQYVRSQNDTLNIYMTVIERIRKSVNYKINVDYITYKLVSYNMKDTTNGRFDREGARLWKQSKWRKFNFEIDTSKLTNFSLKSNGKLWFKSKNSRKAPMIKFTPVVISQDKSLAITSLMMTHHDSGSEILYFLEKSLNNKWKVVHSYTISYLD
jgi:hypothetical protein